MVIFVIVLRVLIRHCYRKVVDMQKAKRAQATFKTFTSVVLISFMFGLQWIFGAFTIAEASLAFQWLFVIFSTLQGFFLFLFFCAFTEDAREEWFNLLSCGKRRGRKRTTSTSQGNLRDKRTSSTSSTSKGTQSSTLQKGALSSISEDSTLEMHPTKMRNLLLAMPSPISESRESEVIENKAANDALDNTSNEQANLASDHSMDLEASRNVVPQFEVPEHVLERRRFNNTSNEQVDLASDHSMDLETSRNVVPQFEVPEHVLERRQYTFYSNPASTLDNMNSKKKDKDDDEASLPSTTGFVELTQQTDLTILTNSDTSGAEEITSL